MEPNLYIYTANGPFIHYEYDFKGRAWMYYQLKKTELPKIVTINLNGHSCWTGILASIICQQYRALSFYF